MNSKEFIETIKKCSSKEELTEIAKKEGVHLSEKEAEFYFNNINKTGIIADDELDIVGGGRTYSTNSHHQLITTWGNTCDGYTYNNKGGFDDGSCFHCINMWMDGLTSYCKARTKENDPYAD